MALGADDAEAGRGVDQETWLHENAKTATNCCQPIDGSAGVGRRAAERRITGRGAGTNANVGPRYIGLKTVHKLLRLPVVAGLGASDATVGVPRPAKARMHTSVQTLPDGRIVTSFVDHGAAAPISSRWRRHRDACQ